MILFEPFFTVSSLLATETSSFDVRLQIAPKKVPFGVSLKPLNGTFKNMITGTLTLI